MDVLQSFLQYATTPIRRSKPKLVEEVIYLEELINKKLQAPMKVKKKVQFESKINDSTKKNYSELVNEKDYVGLDYGEKSVSQVKILMRKEEAARLLSKCKPGGVLEFKDVANELFRNPNIHVNTVSSNMKND